MERFIQLFFHFCRINNSLIYLCLIECVLNGGLNLFGQYTLDKLTHWLSVDSMSVSHSEEMSSPVFSEMRKDQEGVLVHFIWVLWRVACLGGKGEFSHAVIKLFAGLSWLDCLESC